jgi:predicted nucleic acid-binding protein
VKRVFVDTGAWIALAEQSDVHHLQAIAIADELSRANTLLMTTDYILDETITWFRYNASHKVAADFAVQVLSSNVTEIFYIDETIFNKAFELFRKYDDQKFSFTDCSSFVLMRAQRIRKAFSFDSHFITAGFELARQV